MKGGVTAQQEHGFGSFFLNDVLEWIRDHLIPEDVFEVEQLTEWACETGFSLEEEIV